MQYMRHFKPIISFTLLAIIVLMAVKVPLHGAFVNLNVQCTCGSFQTLLIDNNWVYERFDGHNIELIGKVVKKNDQYFLYGIGKHYEIEKEYGLLESYLFGLIMKDPSGKLHSSWLPPLGFAYSDSVLNDDLYRVGYKKTDSGKYITQYTNRSGMMKRLCKTEKD